MARAGLYKTEVQKARDSLIAQGKHPSVDAIRVALGNTGSKTTIHRYLKELEAESSSAPPTDVLISDSLRNLVAQLAARLVEEADARIADMKTQFDAARQKAADALANQEREGRALSDRLQRAETALQEETRLHQEALGQLQERTMTIRTLEERRAGLEARLADQDAHTQSLEQKHTQAREALEHFRQSSKEQRDTESHRHEQQVQMLQVELRQANDLVTTKNHETMQLNRDNARLTERHGQTENTLRTLRREYEQVAKVAKEVPDLQRQNETLGQQRIQATNERDYFRGEAERYAAELSAERQARLVEIDEQRRREARLQAIEELLVQLKPKDPAVETPKGEGAVAGESQS
ncbi:MAG: DNA-binding protein [Rhodanobacter sp.]